MEKCRTHQHSGAHLTKTASKQFLLQLWRDIPWPRSAVVPVLCPGTASMELVTNPLDCLGLVFQPMADKPVCSFILSEVVLQPYFESESKSPWFAHGSINVCPVCCCGRLLGRLLSHTRACKHERHVTDVCVHKDVPKCALQATLQEFH